MDYLFLGNFILNIVLYKSLSKDILLYINDITV